MLQKVYSFNDVTFSKTDTCPQEPEWLDKLTKITTKYATTYSVPPEDYHLAWSTWRKDFGGANTACHANLAALPKDAAFLVNAYRWKQFEVGGRYPEKTRGLSEEFARKWFDWMLDPKESLWCETLDNCAVLLEVGTDKPLGILWLNPSSVPIIPLVHFCITGARFVTEHRDAFRIAEHIYNESGSMLCALWGAHIFDSDGIACERGGHTGFMGAINSILKCVLGDKSKIPQDLLKNGNRGIYINKHYDEHLTKANTSTIAKYIQNFKKLSKET